MTGKEKKLSQKELAAALEVGQATVSHWESGRQEANPDQRKKVADFFGISEAELISENLATYKPEVPLQKIPVISWVHANRFFDAEDPFPPGIGEEYIFTTTKGKNIFSLRVKDDCMEPEFLEGDLIVVKPSIEPNNNDYVIVKDHQGNKATFKQLKKYGSKVILHPLNPKYTDLELDQTDRYEIIGVIVEKVKKYR